jgi:acetylglutamate kinase
MSVIVIKYGGSLLEEPGHRAAFLKDVAALFQKQDVLLVHGGGKEISRQMEQAGLKPKFVNGRRCTDEATMEVVKRALVHLNNGIVAELGKLGVPAFGRSGQEDHLMEADVVQELGRVGIPRKVNAAALEAALKKKAMPVFYSVAEDSNHHSLNVNADDFALELAVAAQASRLVFLTDTGGLIGPDGKILGGISDKKAESLIESGVITGGMVVKIRACIAGLKRGNLYIDMDKNIRYLLAENVMFCNGTTIYRDNA